MSGVRDRETCLHFEFFGSHRRTAFLFAVTRHARTEWLARQIMEAFAAPPRRLPRLIGGKCAVDPGSGGEIGRQLYDEFGGRKLYSVNFQGMPADKA